MWIKDIIANGLQKVKDSGISRRVRIEETREGFVMIIVLMVMFFIGLGALEFAHMYMLGTWNEVIFNRIPEQLVIPISVKYKVSIPMPHEL